MNKSEKEHCCQRIKEIAARKLPNAKYKAPDFVQVCSDLLRDGTPLKLKPAKDVCAAARNTSYDNYRDKKLRFDQVFEAPMAFTAMQKLYEDEKAVLEKKTRGIYLVSAELIDRVKMGVIKDPLAAIKEAEGWKV